MRVIEGMRNALTGSAIRIESMAVFAREVATKLGVTYSSRRANGEMKIPTLLWRFVFVTLASIPARAQIQVDWSQTYATPLIDFASVAKVDPAGNVYVAGRGNGAINNQGGHAFIAAWSSTGASLWTKTFDSALGSAEYPGAIAFDGAGGLYVAGSAAATTFGVYGGFLLRLDASGAITWSVDDAATSSSSAGKAIVVDAQGTVIVGAGVPGTSGALAINGYTPAGALAWQATYTGSMGGIAEVADLALGANGEIVVIATANVNVPGAHVPVLIRLASNGAVLQTLEITTPELQVGAGVNVEVDSNGRIFAAVNGRASGVNVDALMLLCFTPQGSLSWLRSITGPQQPFGGGAYAQDLALDSFGRTIVTGGRAQGSSGVALLIAAYDANGSQEWQSISGNILETPGGHWWNQPSRLLLDVSGESTVVGSYSPALADTVGDAYAFAVDSTGVKRYAKTYGFPPMPSGSSMDRGVSGAIGNGQSFVIVGLAQTSSNNSTGFDAFVAHFTRTASGFCFGDGAIAACPCGNASTPIERSGCASSIGVGGRLADLGASSLAADTLKLVGSSMPNSIAVYYQGTIAGAGAAFGDGLACVRGEVVRLGEAINVAGSSQFPVGVGQSIASIGQVASPGTRVYQAVYRNASSFCTDKAFNSTNGMHVTWIP